MNNIIKKIFVINTLIFLILISFYCFQYVNFDSTIYIESSINTIFAPVLEHEINPTKNYIYSAAMQIGWNKLINNYFKETFEIENQPSYIKYINAHINDSFFIADETCKTYLGINDNNIINQINNDLVNKNIKHSVINNSSEHGLTLYSTINKEFIFANYFESFKSNIKLSTNEIKVKSFGFLKDSGSNYHGLLRNQVYVHYLSDAHNIPQYFIIELKSNSIDDSIIISTLKPKNTMFETFESIQKLSNATKYKAQYPINSLKIPKLNFNIFQRHTDLIDKTIKNSKIQLTIIDAINNIHFKIGERGVKLSSSYTQNMLFGISPDIIVNKAFVIYLINKKSKLPYFMAYIGNDELLLK